MIREDKIGAVRLVPDGDRVDEGWHPCDGSTLNSNEWPEFVREMGIKLRTFTLPNPWEVPGAKFYIRLR